MQLEHKSRPQALGTALLGLAVPASLVHLSPSTVFACGSQRLQRAHPEASTPLSAGFATPRTLPAPTHVAVAAFTLGAAAAASLAARRRSNAAGGRRASAVALAAVKEISAQAVKELRERSRAGILDCQKALKENDGDMEKAMDWLRKKGIAKADKKAGNATVEGTVASYVHFNSKIATMVEVNSETDFVAANAVFKEFANDVAMQIAANPSVMYVSVDDVPEDIKAKERDSQKSDDLEGKPEHIQQKIIDGRLAKKLEESALLNQKWLKDENKSVQEALKEVVAKLGENVVIRRFTRLTLGEGLEKKDTDFAAGVEQELAKYRVEEPAQPAAQEVEAKVEVEKPQPTKVESAEEQMQWVMQYMKEHADEVPNLKHLCQSGLLSKLTEEFEAKVPAPAEAPAPEAKAEEAAPPPPPPPPPEAAKAEEGVSISAAQVKELRERSGAGILDSKKALKESGGDLDKAIEWLKKKGMAKADKKVGNLSVEGAVASYVHFNSKFGVLVEVNSETDFVAMNDIFKEFASDVAMQIASNPEVVCVSVDNVPQDVRDKEREVELGKEDLQGKPEDVKDKMVEGRLRKKFAEMALLSQKWLNDEDLTVQDVLKQKIAKLGENIVIRRFERLTLGEGLEKKQDNFAEGVEKELAKYRA